MTNTSSTNDSNDFNSVSSSKLNLKMGGIPRLPALTTPAAESEKRPKIILDFVNLGYCMCPEFKLERAWAIMQDAATMYDVIAVSDASIVDHIAKFQTPSHVQAFLACSKRFHQHYFRTARGASADPVILQMATLRDCPILSDDRYRDWKEYPIAQERGRVIRAVAFRDMVIINQRVVQVEHDLAKSSAVLEARLKRKLQN